MVIAREQAMARRRKAAGNSKAAAKTSTKTRRKNNSVKEGRVNGSLMTPSTNESEESCVSQDDNMAPLTCKTPIDLCPADPSHGEPPPVTEFKINSSPQHVQLMHKKFRKFRHMLETDVVDIQDSCQTAMERVEMAENQMEHIIIESGANTQEVIIDQEIEVGETQEIPVVWEEVVEETVVCEGMEVEIEDTRSQDNAVLEEGNSQECNVQQVLELQENGQIVVMGEDEYSEAFNQQVLDVTNIASIGDALQHRLVVNEIELGDSQDSKKELGVELVAVCTEDSQGSLRNMEEVSEECRQLEQIENITEQDAVNIPSVLRGNIIQTSIIQISNTPTDFIERENTSCDAIRDIRKLAQDNNNSFVHVEKEITVENSATPECESRCTILKESFGCDGSSGLENLKKEDDDDEPPLIFNIEDDDDDQTILDMNKETNIIPTRDVEEDNCLSTIPEVPEEQSVCFRGGSEEGERKQVVFRSRSGSTDTTGSESSSNCSSGVRRSNRIRSIGMKQRFQNRSDPVENMPASSDKEAMDCKANEGRDSSDCCSITDTLSDKENSVVTKVPVAMSSPATVQGLVTPAVPGYDLDSCKPVKVKSRWRRSSELEMGGNRSSDSELAATPPTPSISPRLMVPITPSLSPRPAAPATPSPAVRPVVPNSASVTTEQSLCAEALKKDVRNEKREKEDKEMEERLRTFEKLMENHYLTERTTSKEAKRMVCDCFLTKDELARGELGCGEDCLNRLLMIECGSRCPVGDRCTNKRFQKQEYVKCEIFKTEKKGFGLRALEDLPVGTFIMEYVGEVVDSKEFRRRTKEYAKDRNHHFYFMALKSDAFIDATMKGNISRFINHSCDPNAETQKWTVNGELRIGFFSKKAIPVGEEITFDYQFKRFGKEAQRCHCGSSNCRGWIGENPEKEKRDRKERKEREQKKKREEKRREVKEFLEGMDLEEEIEKLCASGLKNRAHTLTLCRLMVRAEDKESRTQLLKLLQRGEPACRRLFLDYHGLRLIWSWMMDVGSNNVSDGLPLRMEILHTLSKLPIPNKTVLQDSKVMAVVEKWAFNPNNCLAEGSTECTDNLENARKERLSLEEESGSDQDAGKPRTDAVLPRVVDVPDEETLQGIENEKQLVDGVAEKNSEVLSGDLMRQVNAVIRGSESDEETSGEVIDKMRSDSDETRERTRSNENANSHNTRTFLELAGGLLTDWATLKEVFRIPKKERIEQMKEHEREADRGYKEYLDKENHDKQSYDRHWRQDRFRGEYDKRDRDRKRTRESPDSDRNRKGTRFEDRIIVPIPKISKEERRQLFAMKVAQEEEEERQRRQQQEMWRHHEDRCLALGLDPNLTSSFDPQNGYHCYYDPPSGTWQPYPPQETLPPSSTSHRLEPPSSEPVDGWLRMEAKSLKHVLEKFKNHNSIPPPQSTMPGEVGPSPIFNPSNPVSPHLPPLPSQGVPTIPPQGVPSHIMPPSGYDPNNPHIPPQPLPAYDPVNNMPHPQHHPVYTDPRPPVPGPIDPTLPEFIPLPSGPQPPPHVTTPHVYTQQPPPHHQHIYPNTPVPGSTPSPIPSVVDSQSHYHHPHPHPHGHPHPHQVLPLQQPIQQPMQQPIQQPIQQPFVPTPLPPMPPPIRLPPKWKSAKDSEGRVYYYHVKTRISQWEPPQWTEADQQPESETSTESSEEEEDEDEDEDSSSSEEEEIEQEEKLDEDDDEDEDEEVAEEKELEEDESKEILSAGVNPVGIEEEMEVAQEETETAKAEDDEPKRKDKRREGLVQERIISPRREEDRQDMKKYREIKEKLRRKKEQSRSRERSARSKKRYREAKQRSTSKSEKPLTAAADTSSESARKKKDQFRLDMAKVIVQYLNPYRKPDCKVGRITNTEDFKHLARKLTHFVMLKELKHCRSVDDLECNENVKHKARDFVKKYMAKFGTVYQRPKDDD